MHGIIFFLAGVVIFYTFLYFPFSIFLFSAGCFIYLAAKKKFIVLLILFTGVAYAFLRYDPAGEFPSIRDDLSVQGTFSSYPEKTQAGNFRQTFTIQSAVDLQTGEKIDRFSLEEIILLSDREFEPDRDYELRISLLMSRKRFNPGLQHGQDIYAKLVSMEHAGKRETSLRSIIGKYRYRVNKAIEEHFEKDQGALIASLTTGQMSGMNEELREAFNAAGLAHILSISGTHFGLFSVLLYGIFQFFIRLLPYRMLQRLTIYLTPSQAAAILSFPFMLTYLGLSGGSIPAIRSFIMISLFLVGLIIGRKGFWLHALLLAACILAVWDPGVMFSISFQLSFLAVMFIGFSIRREERSEKSEKSILRYGKNTLLMTLAASLGTAPLVAYYFHYFSLISPVSNLIIAPLIGFILIPFSLVSVLIFLVSGSFPGVPILAAITDISIASTRGLADIPFANIQIPSFPVIILLLFYGGFLAYCLLKRRKYLSAILLVPIAIYVVLSAVAPYELKITSLDVGQGDSAVVELPDGKTLVIDTGKTGRETASFLRYRGIEKINALILSHAHPDHTGGLNYILRKFSVKEIWDNGRMILPDIPGQTVHRSLSRGDVIEGEGYSISVFHPYPEFYSVERNEYVAANNDSLVMKIQGTQMSVLFTGDVQAEAEEDIRHIGRWLKSDVMKVPHHGSRTSAFEPFFRTVSPDIALISVERDNAFGHPHEQTLQVLKGVTIYRTDVHGAITIQEKDGGFITRTCRDLQLERAYALSDEMKNAKKLFETW